MLLLKHDRRIYVDVSVARPTAAAHLRNNNVTWRPLVAADARCVIKRRKYTEVAALNGYDFCAFTLETYGGLSHEGRKLLQTLATHAPDDLGERTFLQHAYRALSTCLQKGNATLDQLTAERTSVEKALCDARIISQARRRGWKRAAA